MNDEKIVLDIRSCIYAHTMVRMLMQKLDDCQIVISESPGATAEWCKRICQVCLEMQYFKTAVLRRGAENNGLAVFASAAAIKGIEPINR